MILIVSLFIMVLTIQVANSKSDRYPDNRIQNEVEGRFKNYQDDMDIISDQIFSQRSVSSPEIGRLHMQKFHYVSKGFLRYYFKYFKASNFSHCAQKCLDISCKAFSYRWDGRGICRISKTEVDISEINTTSRNAPHYDTYSLASG